MKAFRSQHNLLFRTGRFLLRLLALLLVLIAVMMAGGAKARADLKTRYQPRGQMVDIGGYRLHIHCMGEGSPAVIMDAGNGESSLDWSLVQPEVARSTRVCAYDRPGYGWSDLSPLPRTPESNVKELHALLKNAGIAGPYVLVAHSYGGLVTRLYAHTYPDEVTGMVLVDTPADDLLDRLSPDNRAVFLKGAAQGIQQMRLGKILQGVGILPLYPALVPVQRNLPADVAAQERALIASDDRFFKAYAAELSAYDVSFAQMQAAHITSLGNIPLRVLSRGKSQAGFDADAEQVWQQLQIELVSLSSNGKRIVAEESGHLIQVDQPDLVIGAIQDVLSMVRK